MPGGRIKSWLGLVGLSEDGIGVMRLKKGMMAGVF